MKGKVYGFLGDGSYITSKPFADYCRSLQSATCEVEIVADSGRDTGKVCVDIVGEDRDCGIILIGYSLGANGCAWVQSALVPWCKMLKIPVRPIELIVGFDPTSSGSTLSTALEDRVVGGKQLRFFRAAINTHGMTFLVELGTPMKEVWQTLHIFRNYLLWLAPLVLLISAAGGYWLSHRALAPVDALTRTARTISG